MTTVPNVNVIFKHIDEDGDRIEIISSRKARLTVKLIDDHSVSQMTYIGRDDAVALRDALTQWLVDGPAEKRAAEQHHWCGRGDHHGPHDHGQELRCLGVRGDTHGPTGQEAAPVVVNAFDRANALKLAVELAPQDVTPARLLDAADQMAHWIATGSWLPDTDRVVAIPRDMNFIDATASCDAPIDPCPHCSHVFHGNVGCGEGGRGLHRCRCNGVLR